MNNRFKKLTVKLAKQLEIQTWVFLSENLKKEENTTDVINLILSSGLSTTFTCMLKVSEDLDDSNEGVKKFKADLENYISTLPIIKKMETLK
jgi:hypothetical protein